MGEQLSTGSMESTCTLHYWYHNGIPTGTKRTSESWRPDMAHGGGYFEVRPISPGCPFPLFRANSSSIEGPCDLIYIGSSPDAFAVWRIAAVSYSCIALILCVLEFVGLVQLYVDQARQLGWGTHWFRERNELRSFKSRMMQAIIVLMLMNVFRAIDPYGIFGLVPPALGHAAVVAATITLVAIGLLFDLSLVRYVGPAVRCSRASFSIS